MNKFIVLKIRKIAMRNKLFVIFIHHIAKLGYKTGFVIDKFSFFFKTVVDNGWNINIGSIKKGEIFGKTKHCLLNVFAKKCK